MKRVFAVNDRRRWWIFFCTVSRSVRNGLLLVGLLGSLFSVAVTPAETKLTLEQAVRLALEHSYNLKAAEHDSLATFYQERAAQSEKYPLLSLEATGFHLDELQEVRLPIGAIDIGSQENYLATAKLSLPLYTGGKIGERVRVEQQNLLAAGSSLAADRLQTAYQCRRAYLSLQLSGYLRGAAQASLDRIQVVATNVANLHASGLADSLDILEVELARLQTLEQLDLTEKMRADANSLLAQLLGLPAGDTLVASDTLSTPDLTGENYFDTASGGVRRPELKVLDHGVRALAAQAALLSAQRLPDLYGYVSYTGGKPNRDLFNETWNDYFTVGAAMSWDLNLGGKTARAVTVIRQRQAAMQMKREQLHESLRLGVETAGNEGRFAYRSLRRALEEYQVSQRKYQLASEKQQAGRLTVNRLLEVEADLTRTEQMYQAAKINYYLAINAYLYASGSEDIYGGFSR